MVGRDGDAALARFVFLLEISGLSRAFRFPRRWVRNAGTGRRSADSRKGSPGNSAVLSRGNSRSHGIRPMTN